MLVFIKWENCALKVSYCLNCIFMLTFWAEVRHRQFLQYICFEKVMESKFLSIYEYILYKCKTVSKDNFIYRLFGGIQICLIYIHFFRGFSFLSFFFNKLLFNIIFFLFWRYGLFSWDFCFKFMGKLLLMWADLWLPSFIFFIVRVFPVTFLNHPHLHLYFAFNHLYLCHKF